MLSQSVFEIKGDPLKIKSDNQLDERGSLSILVKSLAFDLNHNIEGSIAYRFNEASVNEKIIIPIYFKKFLEVNLKMREGYKKEFDPILPKELDLDYEIGKDFVVKRNPFVLDTSYLRSSFLVDYIGQELKASGVINFLVTFQNLVYASGERDWIFSHELLQGAFGIKEEAILITEYAPQLTSNSNMRPQRLIIKSTDLLTCRIEELRFPELSVNTAVVPAPVVPMAIFKTLRVPPTRKLPVT